MNRLRSLFPVFLLLLFFAGSAGATFFFLSRKSSKTTSVAPIVSSPTPVASPIPSPSPQLTTLRVPILLYHYIEIVTDKRDTIRESLNIHPDVFDHQIKTLVDAGYTFMTAKDLADVMDGKTQLPAKPVILTFDDGHWDLDTVIVPILEKYHVKGTAYIISGFIGKKDFLTQSQLQDVIASGVIEVGAHTVHHLALKGRSLKVDQTEIIGSKTALESTYHLPVVSFAYPDGSFDAQAAQVVQSAGFETAVSTMPGIMVTPQNRYFLYRLRPGSRTGQTLLTFLSRTSFGKEKVQNGL